MGVKGFGKIVESVPECIKYKKFQEFKKTSKVLDSSPSLYRFCIAIMDTENYISKNGTIIGHLFACFFKTHATLRYGIMPIWVHDGKPPAIKHDCLVKRRKIKDGAYKKLYDNTEKLSDFEKLKLKKRTFSITSEHIQEVKYLLNLMGIPSVDAPGEAEAQCAALDISDKVEGVVSEDWDSILFGCKYLLKDFSNKSIVKEINSKILLNKLGMTKDQLIDLAAILGTDYCDGIKDIKPMKAYKKFKKCNFDMDLFLDKIKKHNLKYNKRKLYSIPENFIQQCQIAKDYYLNAPVIDPNNINIKWKQPEFDKLEEYLIEKGFDKKIIEDKIKELRYMYNFYTQYDELFTLSKIKKILQENPLIDQSSTFSSRSTESSNSVKTYPQRRNNQYNTKPYIKKNYNYENR